MINLIESELQTSSYLNVFSSIEKTPIGVASLAQVHTGRLLGTNQKVAIKVQHPLLERYSLIDIETCYFFVKLAKKIIPQFELDWLADEMHQSLPEELDFVNESLNAVKCKEMFKSNPLVKIPEIFTATPKLIIMECKYY